MSVAKRLMQNFQFKF
jgi:hypothetical protein